MHSLQSLRPVPPSERMATVKARSAEDESFSTQETFTMTISYRAPWEVRATLATARFFAWLATFLRREAAMYLESQRREGIGAEIRVYVSRER